jgi:hypothetical protein
MKTKTEHCCYCTKETQSRFRGCELLYSLGGDRCCHSCEHLITCLSARAWGAKLPPGNYCAQAPIQVSTCVEQFLELSKLEQFLLMSGQLEIKIEPTMDYWKPPEIE